MFIHFKNALLCDNAQLVHGDLWVDLETGKIVRPNPGAPHKTIDLNLSILAPGFIDVQINGIYGLNFSNLNSSDPKAIKEYQTHYKDAMTKYLSTGVTSLCPTVTSNFPEVYENVLPIVGPSRSSLQADSLGAHLEGPFINIKKKGCHPVETFVDAHEGSKKVYSVYGGEANLYDNVCIVTAAPEIPGVLDAIPDLKKHNITYSIGHTAADYATGLKAIDNGATMITHLYNAMPQPHHRDVGVVGLITSPIPSTYGKDTPYFGLIADGVHVDPSMCAIAYRSAPDKCMLVTDAMHLIGLPDGTYQWDSQVIVKDGASLKLKGTETLAGAATDLSECIRNMAQWADVSLAQVIASATNIPARAIGVESQKGFLNIGCDADLVILDNKGHIKDVYKLGQKVSARGSNDKIFAQL
ncbi:hypothetical protein CLIB1423_03S07624 [[Candida] railenensis]|uniref:N-acetylglucosamine-6-phosphate deacetylase n=1 Tax=[Candida] railenensis TaxID=45579 RepID=A0A9P0QMK7_9ASCO|nr:hypothetical protein CLIB1423_03S07624 [[Candida] railenensis]